MQRALVVVEPTDGSKTLVEEAGKLASGVGAELVLLHVTTVEEWESNREQLSNITDFENQYGIEQTRQGARQFAENVGHDVLDGMNVDVSTVGAIGDRKDQILKTAEQEACDHVFMSGKKRSPTGKAVFGDVTQSVILNFSGIVSVITTEDR
ncbi:universal stress protein [Haladaptatus sp. CMAA 1911]|uniref:universal stress protein n=1 Tax=unclassified Haladaptatus TaxID=2622732 RepID=UPI0037551012